MTKYFTGTGDDGTTGLLGAERVPKFDPRPSAYGAVDEASASLGFARSLHQDEGLNQDVMTAQRDLYRMMAELAATVQEAEKFRTLDESRVRWLENQVEEYGSQIEMPTDFVVSGDAPASAAFDLARTIVRRAERDVAYLNNVHPVGNELILPYLNRLSSFCFVLSLWVLNQEGVDQASLARKPSS